MKHHDILNHNYLNGIFHNEYGMIQINKCIKAYLRPSTAGDVAMGRLFRSLPNILKATSEMYE